MTMTKQTPSKQSPLDTYLSWLKGAAEKIEELGYKVTIKIEDRKWNRKN